MASKSIQELMSFYFRPWILGLAAEFCAFLLFFLAWQMGYATAGIQFLLIPVGIFHFLLWLLFQLVEKGYTANLRDRRMTFLNSWLSIIVQIPILLFVVPTARDILVYTFCIPLLFGTLRLTYRQSLHLAVYPILGYLLVIWWREGNPFSPGHGNLLILRILMFSVLCIWIGLFSGYIHQMRRKLLMRTKDLNESRQYLLDAQGKLVESAHRAGMAEAAGEVLHNMGHILNSVNVSTAVLEERISQLRSENLNRLSALAEQLISRGAALPPESEAGRRDAARLKLLPEALSRLAQEQSRDSLKFREELRQLRGFVDKMRDILAAHRHFLGQELSLLEPLSPSELLHDLLIATSATWESDRIHLEKHIPALPTVRLQRSKFRHVLQNLLENAAEALRTLPSGTPRILRVEAEDDGQRIRIRISDSGQGIAPEHLPQIFNHGFTTKENGLGFGLHYCACAMQELGGTIEVGNGGRLPGVWVELSLPHS